MSRGVIQTDTVLDRILAQTAKDLPARMRLAPAEMLTLRIERSKRQPLNLAGALEGEHVAVIGEMKRGSPSRGVFPVEVDPELVAAAYKRGGASAISCLTDGPFFHGSLEDLEKVGKIAHRGNRTIPVLRKDFIIDPYQLVESKAWGADAVLLIVGALDDDLLCQLYDQSGELGLSTLVEVHDERETERAMRLDPPVLGVNNRNLKTFDVDLAVTDRISSMVPAKTLLVSESGIFTPEDVARVAMRGADAVLVGESLILQQDREAAVRALVRVPRKFISQESQQ